MKQVLKNKTLLLWLIGATVITIFLWLTVLRFPGYIYYWDLSGAFSFRAPFEQYFSTYTPYDGIEVGLKNRIPVVAIIWVLTKAFTIFGLPEGEIAIKVAVWLMFIGAYSAFFFVVPKFEEIFARKFAVLERVTTMNGWYRLAVSLLYLLIPFYTYRISQLHLFYFTTFYPLLIYVFLKFLLAEKKEWLWWAGALVVGLFFGITTPHSVLYYAITFLFLALGMWSKQQWSLKIALSYLSRLAVVIVAVITVSLYWLVPYFIEGSPSPGYVVSSDAIDFLSQNSTLDKYLLDVSEWYMGQQAGISALFSDTPMVIMQYVGVASLYGFALYYVISRFKASPHIRWLLVLLLATLPLGVSGFPGFSWIYGHLSFSSFGWIIREPNRIRLIWSFWVYLFSVLGFYRYIALSNLQERKNFLSISAVLTIIITVVSYLFYTVPVFLQHITYLKPAIISNSFVEVQLTLEKEQAWGGVLVYPREGGYGLSWKQAHFPIADETEYLFLAYNLTVSPVQRSSVLASGQSLADALGREYLKGRIELTSTQLRQLGLEYFLVVKDSKPLFSSYPSLATEVNGALSFLSTQQNLKPLMENSQYALYKVKEEFSPLLVEKAVKTSESRSIFSALTLPTGLLQMASDPTEISTPQFTYKSTLVVYEDNELAYLDYLNKTDRERYNIDVYSSALRNASPVSWGRMSLVNKVNGEALNIYRTSGISTLDTDITDEVIYSDNPVFGKKADALQLSVQNNCEGQCTAYAKVLKSQKGGLLHFEFGQYKDIVVNTLFSRDTYPWVKIIDLPNAKKGKTDIIINNEAGFQAIARMLVLPNSVQESLKLDWYSADVRTVVYGKNETISTLPACSINEVVQLKSYVFDVRIRCLEDAIIKLPGNWKGSTALYVGKDGFWTILSTQLEQPLELNGKIYLISVSTLALRILIFVNAFQIIVIIALLVNRRKA